MNKRDIGSGKEDDAAAFLERKGCTILDRNYRCRGGEIDIIYLDEDGTVCFGEVKYRENDGMGVPEEAVNKPKQRAICRVSDFYRSEKDLDESFSFRFDVIALTPGETRWIKNAFDYTG